LTVNDLAILHADELAYSVYQPGTSRRQAAQIQQAAVNAWRAAGVNTSGDQFIADYLERIAQAGHPDPGFTAERYRFFHPGMSAGASLTGFAHFARMYPSLVPPPSDLNNALTHITETVVGLATMGIGSAVLAPIVANNPPPGGRAAPHALPPVLQVSTQTETEAFGMATPEPVMSEAAPSSGLGGLLGLVVLFLIFGD
jgi:hypothetical protein